jgi:DNA-binding NtrC family response regulator
MQKAETEAGSFPGPARGLMDPIIRVLLMTGDRHDYESLRALLAGTEWVLTHVRNCAEAVRAVRRSGFPIIILGSDVPLEDWPVLLDCANQEWPPSKVIAVSGFSQEHRWHTLLERGAYDVLARPYNAGEALQVMGFAWLRWRRERESRQTGREAERLERRPAVSAAAAAKSA